MMGSDVMTFGVRREFITFAFVAASMASACDIPDGPRRPPFPTFEATAPFPELEGKRAVTKKDRKRSALEEALAETTGADAPAEPATSARQAVLVSSLMVAEVPRTFNEWRWAGDAQTTLVLHSPPGGAPDAIIYTEKFSDLGHRTPSAELLRFQLTVDPKLTFVPRLVEEVLEPLGGSGVGSTAATLQALSGVATRTLGAGLGFRTRKKSFTGWKWIGHNEQRLAFRLGRAAGVLGPPAAPDPRVLDVLDQEATEKPELEGLVGQLDEAFQKRRAATSSAPPRDAYLVIGSIDGGRDRVVHVAILCTLRPRCPVARDLSSFLASMRMASPEEAQRLSAGLNPAELEALSREAGIGLTSIPLESVKDAVGGILADPEEPDAAAP